ncbi:hypothetical protein N5P32_06350 [Marinomonas pontica]|uniref:hypothetical protein n=1 Tax=Marinomonas pontica TaxID=264739 RepID=UPI0022449F95|nr:hypothetical protein [Marinomonas pontica]MCW8355527.1 hypothetical protein [Marinomonas pontica]
MLKHLFFLVSLLCSPSWLLAANPSINELNSCFALVDFVDSKLDEFAGNYAKEDVLAVHAGLSAYGGFLQNDMIKPKLLNMYGGNEAQAKLMQALFDRQKASFYKTLNGRYTEKNSSLNTLQASMIVVRMSAFPLPSPKPLIQPSTP